MGGEYTQFLEEKSLSQKKCLINTGFVKMNNI
jgi:hypothetical protein